MQFVTSIDIRRPIEEVFDFLSTHENHQLFVKENKASRKLTEGPLRVGSHVQNEASFMGMKMVETFEITALVPNQLIAKRSLAGSTVETDDRLDLEPCPDGTKVTLTVNASPKGLQKPFLWLMKPMMRPTFPRILRDLKSVLEQTAS